MLSKGKLNIGSRSGSFDHAVCNRRNHPLATILANGAALRQGPDVTDCACRGALFVCSQQ